MRSAQEPVLCYAMLGCAHACTQVDNKSTTQVNVVEMKLHQRIHLTFDGLLGQTNKHIDVVRVANRCVQAGQVCSAVHNAHWLLAAGGGVCATLHPSFTRVLNLKMLAVLVLSLLLMQPPGRLFFATQAAGRQRQWLSGPAVSVCGQAGPQQSAGGNLPGKGEADWVSD